jgi:hypothetical protein
MIMSDLAVCPCCSRLFGEWQCDEGLLPVHAVGRFSNDIHCQGSGTPFIVSAPCRSPDTADQLRTLCERQRAELQKLRAERDELRRQRNVLRDACLFVAGSQNHAACVVVAETAVGECSVDALPVDALPVDAEEDRDGE